MTSAGIFINSLLNSSGDSYNGTWELTNDVQGYYNVLYTHLDDGDIPIVYEGVNALVVKNNSNSATTVVHFADLSDDTPSVVETWFETELAVLTAALGINIVSATANNGGETYTLLFDADVTFRLSLGTSTASALFGNQDIVSSSSSLTVSGAEINNRPKFLGVCINECNQIYAYSQSSNINCLLSAKDDLVKGIIVYIPNETNNLHIQVVRLNAPSAPCPISQRWSVVMQKSFGPNFS